MAEIVPDMNRFPNFHLIGNVPYGSIRDQPLPLDIWIPKTALTPAAGPRPVLVNFHGGGLMAGAKDFMPWWAVWMIEWAERTGAIVVAPDYPLAPESKTPEILHSIHLFAAWLEGGHLQAELDRHASELGGVHVKADVSRLLVAGESAGGWCALHMGLAYPERIRALIMRFPMLDLEDDFWQRGNGGQPMLGLPIPPMSDVDEHFAAMVPGKIITARSPMNFHLTRAIITRGRTLDSFGNTDETYVLKGVKAGKPLPKKVWIFQGKDDSVAFASSNEMSASLIKDNVKGTEVHYDTYPGEHGFDTEWQIKDKDLVGERLTWLEERWLA